MPDLAIEFSKYDLVAVIVPGSLIMIGIMTFFPSSLYFTLHEVFKTEAAYLFIIALAFIVFSFILGKMMSQLSFWLIEKTFVIPNKKELMKDYEKEREYREKIENIKKDDKLKEHEKLEKLELLKEDVKKSKIKRLGYPSYNLLLIKYKHKKFSCFNYFRAPFNTKFREKFEEAYNEFFDEKVDILHYFPLLYFFVKEHSTECASRLTTFSALYHFFRSLTLAFISVAIGIGSYHACKENLLYLKIITPIAGVILAYVCFIGYLRYFKIFSTEVINSFYVFHHLDKKKKDKKIEKVIYFNT